MQGNLKPALKSLSLGVTGSKRQLAERLSNALRTTAAPDAAPAAKDGTEEEESDAEEVEIQFAQAAGADLLQALELATF